MRTITARAWALFALVGISAVGCSSTTPFKKDAAPPPGALSKQPAASPGINGLSKNTNSAWNTPPKSGAPNGAAPIIPANNQPIAPSAPTLSIAPAPPTNTPIQPTNYQQPAATPAGPIAPTISNATPAPQPVNGAGMKLPETISRASVPMPAPTLETSPSAVPTATTLILPQPTPPAMDVPPPAPPIPAMSPPPASNTVPSVTPIPLSQTVPPAPASLPAPGSLPIRARPQ